MPRTDSFPTGAPCWTDLFTSDTDKAVQFYGELFGWTAEEPNAEFGGYFNFRLDGVRVAGCMKNDPSTGQPDVWSVHLATDDVEKVVETVPAHGGQVISPAMQVGNLGTMAILLDAGGAAVGAWKAMEHTGSGIVGEPGAPSWFELHTRDYDASVAFYRDVFRWDAHTMSDTPEFRYTTLFEGDAAAAGIMDAATFLPEGVPAHWAVYFGSANTDASLETVVRLGGSVVMPPEDTPYGRLAAAADPTGASFRLIQPPAA